MGRTVKYEVVTPHYCPECQNIVAQFSKTAAFIWRGLNACPKCDRESAVLLLKAYHDGLKVTFIERGGHDTDH